MKIKLYTRHEHFKDYLRGHEIVQDASQADLLISYDWPKKIPMNRLRGINLHISYLPYNRGTDPNLWSWIEDTPKGVTIHWMDEEIDTGSIVVQKKIDNDFLSRLDLRSSYGYLHSQIEGLFKDHFPQMLNYPQQPQDVTKATHHFSKDMKVLKEWLAEREFRVLPEEMVAYWKRNNLSPRTKV